MSLIGARVPGCALLRKSSNTVRCAILPKSQIRVSPFESANVPHNATVANQAFPGEYNCKFRVFFVTSLWSVMRDAAQWSWRRVTTSAQLESNKSIVTFIPFPKWTRSYRINEKSESTTAALWVREGFPFAPFQISVEFSHQTRERSFSRVLW